LAAKRIWPDLEYCGRYSFYRDARLRRLTRYRYNNVPLDSGGRYIYLRDNESQSSGRLPGSPRASRWKTTCAAMDGYSIIGSTHDKIETRTRYFVPLDEDLEIWQMTVTNHRRKPARLSVFSSIEFCLWDALDDATNFQRNFSTGQVEFEDGVITIRPNIGSGGITSPILPALTSCAAMIHSGRRSWALTGAGRIRRSSNGDDPRILKRMAGRPLAHTT